MMFNTSILRAILFFFSVFAVAQAMPGVSKTITKTVTVTATTTLGSPSSTAPAEGQCNTGPIQCCQLVEPATGGLASALLGLLGIILEDLNIDVGINCSPLSVIGVGGTNCVAAPVCCENDNFNGIISIGCSPIIINL